MGYGEIVFNGGVGLGVLGGFGGCIVLYVIDKFFFIGRINFFGGCGFVCGVVGIIFICEYVVGLFCNFIIVDNGNRKIDVNIIVMYEKKVFYIMWFFKFVNGVWFEVVNIEYV